MLAGSKGPCTSIGPVKLEDLAEEGTWQPSLLTGSAKVHVGGSDGGHGRGEEPERSRPRQPWRGLAGRRR